METPGIDIGQVAIRFAAMHAVSYFAACENLGSMIDKVVADRAALAITRQRGQEGAALISASEGASIEETLYLLSSPTNAARLLEAVRGFEVGNDELLPLPWTSYSRRARGKTCATGRTMTARSPTS